MYCINPECKHRENDDNLTSCETCGTSLLIRKRYRLIRPLRLLDRRLATEIFEVEDIQDNGTRKVLKILKDNQPKLVEKFEEEALTLQWLDRPGIPKVDIDGYFQLTVGEESEPLNCLVMEKIEGEDLEKWSATHGRISQKVAINWLRQIIELLGVLHENKFFHRDIKPSNIILRSPLTDSGQIHSSFSPQISGGAEEETGTYGELVLIDFGSVRQISNTYLASIKLGSVTTYISSGYTAPEQMEGKALPESDFFAVGRTFVHLLTGIHPVDLPRDGKTGRLIWRDKAPQISQPLADFIDDLMAADPAARPQNTQLILRDLNVKGLLIRSVYRWIWQLLDSPKFKLSIYGILGLFIAGIGINIATMKIQAEYLSQDGREAMVDGDFDTAREKLSRAVELNPKSDKHHSDLGLACKQLKDFNCAEKQYEKALSLDPNDGIIQYNLGSLHEELGRFDRALEYYTVAMKDKKVAAYAKNNFARVQIVHKRNYPLAIDLLLEALQQTDSPANLRSTLYKNLGWAYFQANRNDEAELALGEAIRLDDKNKADPHCLLAQVLQERKDPSAGESWQNCLDAESDNDSPEVRIWQLDADLYLTREGVQP